MRLSLLEEREPVLEIIVKTLNEYYLGKMQFSIECPANDKDYLKFYGNKYLNFFASTSSSESNFEVIRKEYTNVQKVWKKVIQKIYVFFACHPIVFSKFNHYKFYVVGSDKSELSKLLIMGGNSRLRIIDSDRNQTHVILKSGYPDFFIKNEIDTRSKFVSSDFFPTLINYKNISFTESLNPGIPINRLSVQKLIKARSKALMILNEELQKGSVFLDNTYFSKLINSISRQLKRENLGDYISTIEITKVYFANIDIPTCISHGDYQDANILNTKNGIIVIDWESVSQRSVFYDQITLLATTRKGFEKSLVNSTLERITNKHLLSNDQIFKLYILEELEYRLDYLQVYKFTNASKKKEVVDLIYFLRD